MTTVLQKNIKRQLEMKNLSVAELERRAGMKHAVINIMHGRSKNPSVKVANAIAKELGCSIEDLIDENACSNIKPKSSLKNLPLQKASLPLDCELSKKVFSEVSDAIMNNGAEFNFSDLIECFSECYTYCIESPQKNVDSRFIKWFVEKSGD